jgi:F-type H+-transporting ATPase subunit a
MYLMLAASDPLEHVLPHTYWSGPTLFTLFGFPFTLHITNQMIMIGVASLLMLMIFPSMFSRPDTSPPTGAKNLLETILEFMRNEVFRPCLKENTDMFVPFLWTVFTFILFCNLLGCIPFPEIFELVSGGKIQHLGGTATGSINTTATLAVIAFFFIHFHGLAMLVHALRNGTYGHHHHDKPDEKTGMTQFYEHPHAGEHMSLPQAIIYAVPLYLWNFAPHPFHDKGPVVDAISWFPLLLLELIGAVIKPFALCMRLFGNMVSGHMVLAALIGLIVVAPTVLAQVGVGIPIMLLDLLIQLLELLVAFLQAYIFAFLTAMFIAGAVAPEH